MGRNKTNHPSRGDLLWYLWLGAVAELVLESIIDLICNSVKPLAEPMWGLEPHFAEYQFCNSRLAIGPHIYHVPYFCSAVKLAVALAHLCIYCGGG